MDVVADAVMTRFVFSCWQTNCTVHIVLSGALTQHVIGEESLTLDSNDSQSSCRKRSSLSLCRTVLKHE